MPDDEDALRQALDTLRHIPPPDVDRQAAVRQAFLEQAHRLHQTPVSARRDSRSGNLAGFPALIVRRLPAAAILIIVGLSAAVTGGGVAYAANDSGPGDPLYGIDRAVEKVGLALAFTDQAQASYRLTLVEERLGELEGALASGDEADIAVASDAYGQEVSDLAQLVGGSGGADAEALANLLDAALAVHETRLTELIEGGRLPEQAQEAVQHALEASQSGREHANPQGGGQGGGQGGIPGGPPQGHDFGGDIATCTASLSADDAEELTALSDEFGVNYDNVLELFCRGYTVRQVRAQLRANHRGGPPEGVPGGPPTDQPGGGQGNGQGGGHGGEEP